MCRLINFCVSLDPNRLNCESTHKSKSSPRVPTGRPVCRLLNLWGPAGRPMHQLIVTHIYFLDFQMSMCRLITRMSRLFAAWVSVYTLEIWLTQFSRKLFSYIIDYIGHFIFYLSPSLSFTHFKFSLCVHVIPVTYVSCCIR